MKKQQLFLRMILPAILICYIFTGCGSSSNSNSTLSDDTITSVEYALITRDSIVVIDTENSDVSCDSSGDECYSFASRYFEVGSQTSVEVLESSGHRFLFEFVSSLDVKSVYQFISGVDFSSQDLRMYVTYDSPELVCDGGCSNVYNYSDTVSCYLGEHCKSYTVSILENSDNFLEFEFLIWNKYFLDESTTFRGHIKVSKKIHNGSEDYLYPENV